ncbi:MAG: hypothetical protein ACRC20_05920 [Segniliparus sp.]|uniref:hypothetical protein n=1 Tax=Segniliparus sp. TaxID=2804064 RepID=UPI003F36EDB7
MARTSSNLASMAVGAALVAAAVSGCDKGGPTSAVSMVTYEVAAQGEGKARVSYLKKVPPQNASASAASASDYVAVEVVSLPWKKQVALDGGSDNAFLTAAFDPSSIEIGADGVKLPGLGSVQYECTITALGKQVDHKAGTGTLTCQGPEAKNRVQDLH